MRRLTKGILLLSLLFLIGSTGCSFKRPVALHIIKRADITQVPAGSYITIPEGTVEKNVKGKVTKTWKNEEIISIEKQGWFVSDEVLNDIIKARLGD